MRQRAWQTDQNTKTCFFRHDSYACAVWIGLSSLAACFVHEGLCSHCSLFMASPVDFVVIFSNQQCSLEWLCNKCIHHIGGKLRDHWGFPANAIFYIWRFVLEAQHPRLKQLPLKVCSSFFCWHFRAAVQTLPYGSKLRRSHDNQHRWAASGSKLVDAIGFFQLCIFWLIL